MLEDQLRTIRETLRFHFVICFLRKSTDVDDNDGVGDGGDDTQIALPLHVVTSTINQTNGKKKKNKQKITQALNR